MDVYKCALLTAQRLPHWWSMGTTASSSSCSPSPLLPCRLFSVLLGSHVTTLRLTGPPGWWLGGALCVTSVVSIPQYLRSLRVLLRFRPYRTYQQFWRFIVSPGRFFPSGGLSHFPFTIPMTALSSFEPVHCCRVADCITSSNLSGKPWRGISLSR